MNNNNNNILDATPTAPPMAASEFKTLYDKLVFLKMEKKLIDIAVAECKLSDALKQDAAQEIRIAWTQAKPKPEYNNSETYSYAYRIATTTALRVRRELGSAVRLPGSAFRKRRDGSSYITPGVLAPAIDFSELEERLSTEDGDDGNPYANIQLPPAARVRLTTRQQHILELLMAGLSFSEIQDRCNIRKGALNRQVSIIKSVMASVTTERA